MSELIDKGQCDSRGEVNETFEATGSYKSSSQNTAGDQPPKT